MKLPLIVLLVVPLLLQGGGRVVPNAADPRQPEVVEQSLPAYFQTGVITLDDRLWAQEQIERVFYNNRIWPKENPAPKPPFAAMVARELIERRANESLQYTTALKQFFNLEITPAMLQAEMERMAKGTQDGATLHELFAALHNDPQLIAETLARQTLSDRLLRSHYAWDQKLHAPARAKAEVLAARADGANWKSWGGEYHRHTFILDEHGEPTPPMPGMGPDTSRVKAEEFAALKKRYSRLLTSPRLRGEVAPSGAGEGLRTDAGCMNSLAAADPATPHPGPLPASGARGPERLAVSCDGESNLHPLETADSFVLQRTISITDAKIEIESLVVPKTSFDEWWEKVSADPVRSINTSGGASNLTTDSERFASGPTPIFTYRLPEIATVAGCDQWTSPSGLNNILPSARYRHTAVWTGTEMIVWGGNDGSFYLNTGGRYNPATDTWAPTSVGTNLPDPRQWHTAVWTGSVMIIWGGDSSLSNYVNTGARYDPLTNKWLPSSTGANVPSGRDSHAAVWTGTEMIIWGGGNNSLTSSGGRYNPASDSWLPTSTGASTPSPRGAYAIWAGNVMIVWGGYSLVCSPSCAYAPNNTGGRYNPASDSWLPTSTGANVPIARGGQTMVWTGTEMILWGGNGAGSIQLNSGGRYNPATDSWQPTSTGANVPAARRNHSAVWTGSRMIVWGGVNCPGSPCGSLPTNYNDGGKYDPATDSWTPTSTGANVPAARLDAVAVWTGSEMAVWGGWQCIGNPCPAVYFNSGGRYNPNTDNWTPTSLGGNVPSGREYHSAVWTGSEMIIWGGGTDSLPPTPLFNTGGRYSPAMDNWVPTSIGVNVPSARKFHSVVWTGNEMIVWGGANPPTGGRYNPITNSWIQTSTAGDVPSWRSGHSAVWTGSEMIIWGGYNYFCAPTCTYYALYTGSRYNPRTDIWVPTSNMNAPSGRERHTAIWTGSDMIIWGGYDNSYCNSGGRYNLASDSWLLTSTLLAPAARVIHTSVWTGKEMIVWGGFGATQIYNSGGRYNPVLNTWNLTSSGSSAPTARYAHSSIWSGGEMIVWGGEEGAGIPRGTDSGGRYNSEADSWLPTSLGTNSPDRRYRHTGIWTGNNMIVWGGETFFTPGGLTLDDLLNTGDIYTSGSVSSPGNSLRGKKSSFINLNWLSVYGAGSYNVKRCNPTATGCIPGTIVSTPTINQYSEPNDGLSHFYAVEAVNQCGATP